MRPERRIKYPVGLQDFERIVTGGYIYVDKTEDIYNLVNNHNFVFLSRPRRFGKSLLISTLEAYFKGKRELFRGLAIEKLETEWVEHEVLRIDLTGRAYTEELDLIKGLDKTLRDWEKMYGIESSDYSIGDRFYEVIQKVYELSGQRVVVLIDEYDKPIIDTLHDRELQEKVRIQLQAFYSVLKKADRYIRFAMLTGVGKFAHLSIFSGLNNLNDISLNRYFNSICGITEREMHEYFSVSVREFAEANDITEAQTWAELKEQYDGYHFCKKGDDIYNPFSVLNAFANQEVGDYWFRSGTPSFLVKLIERTRYRIMNLNNQLRSERELSDITDNTRDIIPLLFQAGYLTIKQWDESRKQFLLDFPNREVYSGFWESLVNAYFPRNSYSSGFDVYTLTKNLNTGDIESFMTSIQSLLASATTDHIVDKEEHFQNMMAIICRMLGLETRTEIHGSNGRCDMTVATSGYIYIFEFKIDSTPEAALSQIEEKGYATPYLADPRQKVLIGANFSTDTRTLTGWQVKVEG